MWYINLHSRSHPVVVVDYTAAVDCDARKILLRPLNLLEPSSVEQLEQC